MTAGKRKGSKFITPERLLPAIRGKRERAGNRAIGTSGAWVRRKCRLACRSLKESDRVLCHAAIADFKVKVRAGGAAGGSRFGDLASALNHLAFPDQNSRAMSVAGREIVAVVNLDQKTVLGMWPRVDHHAASRSENRSPDIPGEIHAFVHCEHAVKGVDAPAVAGGAPPRVDWRNRRHELLLHLGVEQLRLEDPEGVAPVFHLPGKLVEVPVEFRHREILRWDARHRATAAGRHVEPKYPGLQARKGRQAFAERVQAHELGLHLAELHRHGVQIFSQEFFRFAPLRFLRRRNQRVEQRELDLVGMAHRDPEEPEREAEYEQCHEYDAGNQVPVGQGQGPRLGQLARDENNMHAAPSWGRTLRTVPYAYEEPLRFLEPARRHRSAHAAGPALDRVARDFRGDAAGIPGAMLLDRQL